MRIPWHKFKIWPPRGVNDCFWFLLSESVILTRLRQSWNCDRHLNLYLYLYFPFTHSFVFALALAFVHSCTRPFAMLSTNWLCEHDPPFHVDPSGCPPTVPVTAPKRISEQPFPYFFQFSILHFHHFFVSSRVMGMPSSQCTTLYFLSTSEPAPITSKKTFSVNDTVYHLNNSSKSLVCSIVPSAVLSSFLQKSTKGVLLTNKGAKKDR